MSNSSQDNSSEERKHNDPLDESSSQQSQATFKQSHNVVEGGGVQTNVMVQGDAAFNAPVIGVPSDSNNQSDMHLETNISVGGDASIFGNMLISPTANAEFISKLTPKDLGKNLRLKYQAWEDIPKNEWFWPPLCRSQYITLALVSDQHHLREDGFTHKSLHKQPSDDLPYHKTEATFSKVFPENEEIAGFSTLISGRPGIGKTVLLTKVCKEWAKGTCFKDIQVMIHVPLRELHSKSPKPSLLDMIELHVADHDKAMWFCQQIESIAGKGVCFAFDGLDEYPPFNKPNDIVTGIIGKQKLSQAAVIITSRPTTSHKVKRSMKKHAEIIGFLPPEIKAYIENYYEADSNAKELLLRYLEDHPNVKDMCYLPLHLAMIVHLNDIKSSALPETESEIYHRFVSHSIIRYILRERKSEDSEVHIETFDQMKEFLSHDECELFGMICSIAFYSRVLNKVSFSTQDISEFFQRKLTQQQLKRFKKNDLGMISSSATHTEHGRTQLYNFHHLTFQEFLAAYHISQLEEKDQLALLTEHGSGLQMKEVWKFFFGIMRNSPNLHPLFDKIEEQNTRHGVDTLFLSTCVFETQSQELCKKLALSREKKLNINNVILSAPDCSAIGFVLQCVADFITDLMMNYCEIGEIEFHALRRQVEHCKEFEKLTNFQIRSQLNPLKQEGADDLHYVLSKMPHLIELRLYGNQLQSEKLNRINPAIKIMHHLQILVLTKNHLDPGCADTLSELLMNFPNLIQFYASYNPLTTEGLRKIMPGLLKCKNIRRLGLRGCQLDEYAGILLDKILSSLLLLEQLELYWNFLGDKGVQDLSTSLQKAPSLQQVSFTKNEIGDKGGCLLAQAVGGSMSIQQIRLYYNNITSKTRLAFHNMSERRGAQLQYAL